jgi:hypothetical protein
MVILPAILVVLVVSSVLPIVTAAVTKSSASTGIKQFVTALLSAASGLLVTATQLDGTAVISKESAVAALTVFILAQATYLGFWKPHAINAKVAPTVGLG